MRKALILSSLLATALLAGCEARQIPGVYRIDVQQGNVVTREQIARLEPGMEQRKVRFIMGSPLLVDTFNEERWDYVYEFHPGSFFDETVQRRVSLFFENQRLVRVEGDYEQTLPETDDEPREQVVTVPDGRRDTGFFSGLNPFAEEDYRRPPPAEHDPLEPAESATAGPAETAIETDAMEDALPQASPAETDSAAGSGDVGEGANAGADDAAEDGGGFFRGLADSFGFGDAEAAETPAE